MPEVEAGQYEHLGVSNKQIKREALRRDNREIREKWCRPYAIVMDKHPDASMPNLDPLSEERDIVDEYSEEIGDPTINLVDTLAQAMDVSREYIQKMLYEFLLTVEKPPLCPPDIAPWERWPSETMLDYGLFVRYRDLGPARMVSNVIEPEKRSWKVAKTDPNRRPIEMKAVDYYWIERARAWDDWIDWLRRTTYERSVVAMVERHVGLARMIQDKAAVALKAMPDNALTADQILEYVNKGITLEAAARGVEYFRQEKSGGTLNQTLVVATQAPVTDKGLAGILQREGLLDRVKALPEAEIIEGEIEE